MCITAQYIAVRQYKNTMYFSNAVVLLKNSTNVHTPEGVWSCRHSSACSSRAGPGGCSQASLAARAGASRGGQAARIWNKRETIKNMKTKYFPQVIHLERSAAGELSPAMRCAWAIGWPGGRPGWGNLKVSQIKIGFLEFENYIFSMFLLPKEPLTYLSMCWKSLFCPWGEEWCGWLMLGWWSLEMNQIMQGLRNVWQSLPEHRVLRRHRGEGHHTLGRPATSIVSIDVHTIAVYF